jgi:MFS family permease
VKTSSAHPLKEVFGRSLCKTTLLAICFSSVALIGTWAAVQWLPLWAEHLTDLAGHKRPEVKGMTMLTLSCGAILGSFVGPLIGAITGRRIAYFGLCVLSLLTCGIFFRTVNAFSTPFILGAFLAGTFTAAFYGWLPLYLPELFPTRARATGQGLSYNAGRVFAAIGAVTQGQLVHYFGSYSQAGAMITLVYLVGMVVIWFGRETKGQPLPE